jgi:hypothetical protein
MKAEHRKELQTNALADRMGRMVQRIKTRPKRRSVLWMVAIAVLAVVGIGYYISLNNKRNTMSLLWVNLGEQNLTMVSKRGQIDVSPWVLEYGNTNPALAGRFAIAWSVLWKQGLQRLATSDYTDAMKTIANSQKTFEQLQEACKDDPILAPEAGYALAVIQETLAVEDRDHLDKAIQRYKDVESKFKTSAAGKAAGQRAKYLEENRIQVGEFYASLQATVGIFQPLNRNKIELPPKASIADKK